MLTLDRYQDQVEEGVDNAVVTYREVMTSALSQLKAFDRPHYECYDAKLNNNSLPQESETDLRTRGEYLALDFANIGIDLTPTHPATLLLDACGQLEPTSAREPYRFYTQIPSLPKFLLHLAPVLEKRLKESEVWRDVDVRLQVDFLSGPGRDEWSWVGGCFGNRQGCRSGGLEAQDCRTIGSRGCGA